MKKKIIVIIIPILFVILTVWLSFSYYKEYINNAHVKIGKDTFQYKFRESFKGNEWELFINEHYVTYVTPFEGYSKKEMKEHLENEKLIKCLFDQGNLRVYNLPLIQDGGKYIRIYTVNGLKFYSYSDDYGRYEGDPEIKQRLDQLYEKYPKEELKKRAEETWE